MLWHFAKLDETNIQSIWSYKYDQSILKILESSLMNPVHYHNTVMCGEIRFLYQEEHRDQIDWENVKT